MTGKTMKVLYYVDAKDNTKTNFMITDSPKDLRGNRIMAKIAEELESVGFGTKAACESIVWDLAHNNSAEIVCEMGEYEFGIDEVPVLPSSV